MQSWERRYAVDMYRFVRCIAVTCSFMQKGKKRTQNPPRATSWGFDPPSRHHLKYQYPLWNQRLAVLVRGLCFGRVRVGPAQGTSLGTARIHCRFNILAPLAADFISADYPYLRRIAECAADLVIRSLERHMLRRMTHRLNST
jgi:hypothetical protein